MEALAVSTSVLLVVGFIIFFLWRHEGKCTKQFAVIAVMLLVGCGDTQQSSPSPETQSAVPVVEAEKPELPKLPTQLPEPPPLPPEISLLDAAEKGYFDAVKQHIAAGTFSNERDENGLTPLHLAVGKGHVEIVRLLIKSTTDLNAKNDWGSTPLHYAIIEEIAELLIAEGADVNAKDEDGDTPLDWANKRNQTAATALLRKHGGKTSEELNAKGK